MTRGRRVGAFVVLSIASLYTLFFILSASVSAQYGQYGQPQPSKSILIDKFVGKPTTTKGGAETQDFVDNLSPSDPRFKPSQKVVFKLVVRNTSDVKLNNVEVKDTLPQYIEAVEGPGNFDKTTKVIAFNAGNFAPDEEKVFFLTARFVSQDQLPQDRSIICVVNRVQVFAKEVSDEDTAQFCVEKQVQQAKEVPAAGPGAGIALLAFNVATLSAGLWLRRK